MNQQAKSRILGKLFDLEDQIKAAIDEVKTCYEWGRRSGEFFERGDLVGFYNPVAIKNGYNLSKGEIEEVFAETRKVKVFCKHYQGPANHYHISFVVGYDRIFLIKGNELAEEVPVPSPESAIEEFEMVRE